MLKDVCIHCGKQGRDDFLLKTAQPQSQNMTGEYECFPICTHCLDSGKKVVKMGYKKDATQERAEHIAVAALTSNKNQLILIVLIKCGSVHTNY